MTTKKHTRIGNLEVHLLNNVGSGLTRVQLPGDDKEHYAYDATTQSWVDHPPYSLGTPDLLEDELNALEAYLRDWAEIRLNSLISHNHGGKRPLPGTQTIRRKPDSTEFEQVEWTDPVLERELAAAFQKGYLVLPTNRLQELEVCSVAFEPTSRIAFPPAGHLILRFKPPVCEPGIRPWFQDFSPEDSDGAGGQPVSH